VLGALASKDAASGSPRWKRCARARLRCPAGDVLLEHLGDDDLEIRVLAAEYLGVLGVGSAAGKLPH